MKSAHKQVVLHPVMFALYPVAFLYSANKIVFDFSITYAPAIVSVAFAGVLWLAFGRLFSSWERAAVVTSAVLMGIFSYGSLQQFLTAGFTSGGEAAPFWIKLITLCFVAVILCVAAVLRWSQYLQQANYILNVVSIFLVAGPLFQAGMWNFGTYALRAALPDRAAFDENPLVGKKPADRPDIYYFILDGYGREDVLKEDFGFDNAQFLSALRDRGFAVAGQATANYPATIVSVSSALNFTYLDEVVGDNLADATDRRFLRELMRDSRAVRLLKAAGYNTASFEGEYEEVRIGKTDYPLGEWWFPNSFTIGLLQMTPLPTLLSALDLPAIYELHRTRTEYPLVHMRDATDLPGPKFVYTHIYFAHPPFVFGPNGERESAAWEYTWDDGSKLLDEHGADRQGYINAYADQVTYLNKQLLTAIDTILANSEREPIILMHGDHGSGSQYSIDSLENTNIRERYSIFYAARLPDGGNEEIYDSISPVNSFRIVFNRYFGADYPLLEDRAYFAPFLQPYAYTPIENFPAKANAAEPVAAPEAQVARASTGAH